MFKLNDVRHNVSEDLEKFETFFKSSIKSRVPLLDMVSRYVLRTKGKQLRPLLIFLSARLYGNTNSSTYIAATLIELLHTATLIHDDVVDDSYKRRSFFSINAIWKSKISVLVGDFFLSRGLLIAMKHKEYELLEIVTNAVGEMSEGELKQIQKSRKLNINEDEYFEIIKNKTAVLFSACCACGAKSVNAGSVEIEKMHTFGEKIGIAFQIKDDLLDYTRYSLTGKPTANDLKEKKLTLPLIHSLSNVSKSERKQIIKLVDKNKKSQKDIDTIVDFVKSTGGLEYAEKMMIEYKETALNYLTNTSNNNIYNALIQLSNFIINRNK